MPRPLVSVIVPVLNEERVIEALLTHLLNDTALHECIVVDGGSTDNTVKIVEMFPNARVSLVVSNPGRGTQMNAGARRATGDLLLFHHADTQLTDGAFAELIEVAKDSNVRWGGFRHRFAPANWKLRLISALHNFRFSQSGVVYGDQSMFARRDFFTTLGGFSEQPLEDLVFSDAALKQAPAQQLEHHVLTDSRKFTQMGELRAFAHVVNIVVRYQLNRRFESERFFEPYR